jgi:probable F420-dependent oxidoreductase
MRFWQGVAFLETEALLDVARASDRCGYDAVAVSDHIFYPQEYSAPYPYTDTGAPYWNETTPWPDPWVMIGAMAAVTSRIHFTTNVYVAPARDLFTVAKVVSSAAVISGGRVTLGAAPGWCEDEFRQMGQDFATRGKRLNEMIGVLRELWAGGMVSHHGEYFDFEPLSISPVPPGPIPIYIGGDTDAALRRAVRYGDGWIGNAYKPEDADAMLARLDKHFEDAGRSRDGFEVALAIIDRPSVDLYRRYEDKGVTAMMSAPWMMAGHTSQDFGSPLEAKIAAIEKFADKIISKM